MNRNEVLSGLNEIFIDVIDEDEIVLTEVTTGDDIEEWDSLIHIQIVLSVERHFGISISASEVFTLNNIGEFISLIMRKK